MNETMGEIILRLRREKGLTQEQLASALGISYQAVSKWETGNSCPDITALPLLAELFGVSIDALFGRAAATAPESARERPEAELPWPDDGDFYAVLFRGHELLGSQPLDESALRAQQSFRFRFEGPAQNVTSAFDLEIEGEVQGNASAGGDIRCDSVYGDVNAGGDVSCDEVAGDVRAGGDVSCDEVVGNVSAGGDVSCDEVVGSVTAGGDVCCDEIGGNAFPDSGFRSGEPGPDADESDEGEGEELSADLAETIGSLSAWGAKLGQRIAETVEKSLGKPWSFHRSGSIGRDGSFRIDLDLSSDAEEEE